MSDFESFSSESESHGSSAETFRLFQERMKVAAAQIKAIRAGEQKQKKREDKLAKILSDFIKSRQSDQNFLEFIVHITKLLAVNLPAAFILSFLILNFPELQAQTNLSITSLPEALQANALDAQTLPDLYLPDNQLPPYHKIQIDNWIQAISRSALDNRSKLLAIAVLSNKKFRSEIVDFMAFSLDSYLQKDSFHLDPQFLKQFSEFCLQGIFAQIQEPFSELKGPLQMG